MTSIVVAWERRGIERVSPLGGKTEMERRKEGFATKEGEARMTGLEPATSGVTGRCSNQLSYIPKDGEAL